VLVILREAGSKIMMISNRNFDTTDRVCVLGDNKAGCVKGLNTNGEAANAGKVQTYNAVRVGFGRGEDEHPWPFIHIFEEAQ
jgi:hypothetical protein